MPFDHCRLDMRWDPDAPDHGYYTVTLTNATAQPKSISSLCMTAIAFPKPEHRCEGGEIKRRVGSFLEYAPVNGPVSLQPGEHWEFKIYDLMLPPKHRSDGARSGWIELADGGREAVTTGDLIHGGGAAPFAPVLIPEGNVTVPVSLIPWPNAIEITGTTSDLPVAICPAEGTSPDVERPLATVAALARRLFPDMPDLLATQPFDGGYAVTFKTAADLGEEAYRLSFADTGPTLESAARAGLQYGLIALCQMLAGARKEPGKFAFPTAGTTSDAPRYGWRGAHLDVSRFFYPIDWVERFVDILAWNKMNVFHWHLTDDEGWRVEIKSLPKLTETAAFASADGPVLPQFGAGMEKSGGFYTQDEIRTLVEQADSLCIEVVPEVDVPGHCHAAISAYPELADPGEPEAAYYSVQGYPNNSLNPGVEASYDFMEKVLTELADLFPSPHIHLGGDEVEHTAWMESPKARELMQKERLQDTSALQSYFLKKTQVMLKKLGKKTAGWDEVSHGGGIEREGSLLVAWQKPEKGPDLAAEGYDVVMAPGQAYYLDMAQDEAWMEPGLSWAGLSSPEHAYTYEAAGEFPEHLAHKLKGVQCCMWSETINNRHQFNHMVYPRLSAVAEAGWTERENKDWPRFAATCRLMPVL
ncbi:beta-N-acetylhexosaminidase [Cucumibacter marinus]|uniref:beta-N-acetylhexosaminidase n=1 Tax=Cucumibacter marinus TaxID=1121252 RepID=UPI00041B754B|nr:family 20 glycosylhydrolase [Cucumibacter marinus]